MFYDWWVLVVRCLFMLFSYNFLVIPVKKSDKTINNKRLTKSYKSHNEPQSSHCLVMHEDAYLSYRRYKVKKYWFFGHPKVHKYQYTQIHTVFIFFIFFIICLFLRAIKEIKNAKINRCKIMQCMKAWFQKQIRNQVWKSYFR